MTKMNWTFIISMTDRNGLSLLRPYMVFWTHKYDHLVHHDDRTFKKKKSLSRLSKVHAWKVKFSPVNALYGDCCAILGRYDTLAVPWTIFLLNIHHCNLVSIEIKTKLPYFPGKLPGLGSGYEVTFKFSFRSRWGREGRLVIIFQWENIKLTCTVAFFELKDLLWRPYSSHDRILGQK
jgi:hypothetical protein